MITVNDGGANYTYNISGTATTYTASEVATLDTSHTFTGLNPDTYDIEVLSFNGD